MSRFGFKEALAMVITAAGTVTMAQSARVTDAERRRRKEHLTARAMQFYLLYVLLPLWTIPGFGDYLCHRRSKIESTSGTQESLTHALMMAAIGVPAIQALLFETNALTLAVGACALAFHEVVVLWDVSYAEPRRHVSVTEQHVHSFLEVLPFATFSFLLCLCADQALALAGIGDEKPDFRLRPKEEPPPPLYVAGLLGAVTVLIGIPYAEEMIRCMRVDPSLRARPKRAHDCE